VFITMIGTVTSANGSQLKDALVTLQVGERYPRTFVLERVLAVDQSFIGSLMAANEKLAAERSV
jgi:hypothetical protein